MALVTSNSAFRFCRIIIHIQCQLSQGEVSTIQSTLMICSQVCNKYVSVSSKLVLHREFSGRLQRDK